MRKFAIATILIILPLVVGCTGNPVVDAVLHIPMDSLGKAIRMRLELQENENCTEDNPEACAEAWREISDSDFCKRYSPTMTIVARELARRKLDCSKLGDSTSSK